MMIATSTASPAGIDTQAMRMAMVSSQLRTNAVDDNRVVEAMATVPRELFMPEAARFAAYRDVAIPLGGGRSMNMPLATGRLLTVAELQATDRVLLIGAAGGYSAALLAQMVAEVVAVEESASLAGLARTALAGQEKITLIEGPLAAGYPDRAPYDVLIVDGAVEVLQESLVAQLKPGARIAAGLADRGVTRLAFGRTTASGYAVQPFADIECVVLPGFSRPRGFQF